MSEGRRRVVITGAGIISCLGRGRESHRSAVRSGRVGIRTIEIFDPSEFLCRIAGQVDSELMGEEFSRHDRFTRLALIATSEAVEQARIDRGIDREHLGTVIGTGLGGSETLDSGYERMYGRGASRIPPNMIPRAMYNAATSAVSAEQKAEGPAFAVVSACASGAHAIGQAAQWIRSGVADAVIAGAADAPLSPGMVRAWESMRILAPSNGDPSEACRPFSADRAGLVLAEGAAAMVLETAESAQARGATPLGEILGVGMSSDAGHPTDPSPEGAARAISRALVDAGLGPERIGYINAHGTATRANDPAETEAIRRVFGDAADRIPVSSTKAMHGHAMGASGAIELVLSLLSLNEGLIPPTMNYRESDPACDLDYVPNHPRAGAVEVFLSSSFGFGGMNGVVVVGTARSLR